MLKYNVNSWMFHAANLRDYDGAGGNNKSLLSDLLDAVATKYSAMYNLPVLSPSQAEIGEIMKARMAYNAAIAGGREGPHRVRSLGHHPGDQPDRRLR